MMARSPLRAFFVHVGLSALALGVLLAMALLAWYPGPWFGIAGVAEPMLVLAAVVLVLGPLLTLMIWQRGAPGLGFDVAAVVIVQIAALGYGAWTLIQQRPAFVVFDDGRFQLTTWPDLNGEPVPEDLREESSGNGPAIVWAEPITTTNPYLRAMRRGKPEHHLPERYRGLEAAGHALAASGLPAVELAMRDARVRRQIHDLLAPGQEVPENWRIYPVYGRRDGWSAVVDVDSARVVDFVQAHSRWVRVGGERRARVPGDPDDTLQGQVAAGVTGHPDAAP